jgi:hypothetical protein
MALYQMTKTQNAPPPSSQGEPLPARKRRRRRSKQTASFQDRLSEFVADERSKADAAAGCADRYELVKKVRKAETAANIDRWASLPGPRRSSERARQTGGTLLLVPELPAVDRSRARQAPMKTEPMFSIEKDAGGNLRIVITRPDGSRIVLPAHSWRSERVQRPPLAAFLERNYPRRH